jgi:DNA mismatch repair protein MSH2
LHFKLPAANARQNKLKVQLKLSISRLRMVQQKDSAKAKQQRREMAQLLEVRTPMRDP